MSLLEKWSEAVDRKNSVLCAGLDPAEFEMGRGDEGLPKGTNKRDWSLKYIEAVAPFAAAVKPNFQYWKADDDVKALKEINALAHHLGLVVIDDSKLADIGSTNDSGVFYGAQRADAITYSPFAGNIKEVAQQGRDRGIAVISMVLMSNPEYKNLKNSLVQVQDFTTYKTEDLTKVDKEEDAKYDRVPQYIYLAHDAQKHGIEGIVIGAPSAKNHVKEAEIAKVRGYTSQDMIVLCPGTGKQKGEADLIWKYFKNVIGNVGRGCMFPNGSESTPSQQAVAAKSYMEAFNQMRGA